MADGTIKIATDLDDEGLIAKISGLGKSTPKLMAGIAASVAVASTALVGLAKNAFDAGIAYESAFADVLKTVDFSESAISADEMSEAIRTMAKEIPVAATELSSIAASAGQLGIETDNVLDFTRVIADLGVSTNLAGDAAAETLAKFSNVSRLGPGKFSNLGSALVALGNASAATESDIAEMSLRIASAATQSGISQPKILGISAALSSLGLEAQAGGTAFSRIIGQMKIASDVGTSANAAIDATGMSLRELQLLADQDAAAFKTLAGDMGITSTELKKFMSTSKDLESFAEVAGMTSEEFQKLFGTDAAAAVTSFIEGLAGIEATGGSAAVVLDEMGITEVRLSDTLRRLTNNTGIFTEYMDLANESWEENTALTTEAGQRYETLESQLQLLKNGIVDLGISATDSVNEPLRKMVSGARESVEQLSVAFKTDGLSGFSQALGDVIAKGLATVTDSAPQFLDAGSDVIGGLLDGIAANSESIAESAVQIVVSLISGIAENAPKVATTFATLIVDAVPELVKAIPDIVQAGADLAGGLVTGIISVSGEVLGAFGDIIAQGDIAAASVAGLLAAFAAKGALGQAKTGIAFIQSAAGWFTDLWTEGQKAVVGLDDFVTAGGDLSEMALGGALNGIEIAFGALNGQISAGDAALAGFQKAIAFLSGHPVLAILGGIALVAGAFVLIKDAVDDATNPVKQFQAETEKLQTSTADLQEDMAALQEGLSKTANIQSLIARYRELTAIVADSASSTEAVEAASAELVSIRQQLIDTSNGLVTAEGLVSGAFDAQVAALEGLTAAQKAAYDAELLNKFAQAQGAIPGLQKQQVELAEDFETRLGGLTGQYTMLQGLQEKLNAAWAILNDEQIGGTEEGMARVAALVQEAADISDGAFVPMGADLIGLTGTVDNLTAATAGYKEESDALNGTIAANQAALDEWTNVVTLAFSQGLVSAEQGAASLAVSVEAFTEQFGHLAPAAQQAAAETNAALSEIGVDIDAGGIETFVDALGNIVDANGIVVASVGEVQAAFDGLTGAEFSLDATGNLIAANGEIIASTEQVKEAMAAQSAAAIAASDEQAAALARQQAALDQAKAAYDGYAEHANSAFSKIEQNATVSVRQMIKNLETNQAATKQWSDNLALLAEAGLDEGLLQQLRDAGPEAAAQTQILVDEMLKGADGKFPELIEKLKAGAQDAADAAKKVFEESEHEEAVTTFIDDYVKDITAGKSQVEEAAREVILAASGVTITAEEFGDTGKVIPETVAKNIEAGAPAVKTAGATLPTAAASGVTETAPQIKTSLQSAVNSAKSVNTSGFNSIGAAMCAGVAAGIRSGQGDIVAAINAAGAAAQAAFRTAMEIASPSKVMRRLGVFLPQGIALGITDGIPIVEAAVKTMSAALNDAAMTGSAEIRTARLGAIQAEISAINIALDEYQAMLDDKQAQRELADKRAAVKDAKNKKERVKAQEALNEHLKALEMERLRDQRDALEAELDAFEDNVQTLVDYYDFMSDQLMIALENRYEGERDLQLDRIEAEYDAAVAAAKVLYDFQIKQSEEYLRQLEATKDAEVGLLQSRIDAINAEAQAEKDTERELSDAAKIAELQAAVDRAKNIKFRTDAQKKLDEELEKQAKAARERERQAAIDALKVEIETLEDNYDEQKELERARVDALKESYSEQTAALKASYDQQRKYYEAFYRDLLSADKLSAEARRLLLEDSNEEMIALLETYNPQWFNAGKSFGELFVEALGVQMENVYTLIEQAASFAQNKLDWIKAQIADVTGSAVELGGFTIDRPIRDISGMADSLGLSAVGGAGSTNIVVDQKLSVAFNQPIESPAEVTRALQSASKELAYAIP